ncbi:MAG: PKD repeat protein [Candidatus Azotimanducaceae bacterium]|jgi:PKD repeat protein
MKFVLSLAIFVFFSGTIDAQNDTQSKPFPICDIDSRVAESFENDPKLKQDYDALMDFTRDYVANNGANKQAVQYVVPIVFHVIYSGNNDVAFSQIEDAVNVINEDYQLLNADSNDMAEQFKSVVGNPEIEFRLATLDPDGNCTQGVTHHESEMTFSAGENVKSLEIWPVNRYLNVWVVQNIESGAGAYAYYPGTAPDGAEGIVCRASQLGGIGQSNGGNFSRRTLTHEIGHYLNLPHTWGNTNSNAVASNCNSDDGVGDTPNTIGSNQNCNRSQTTCSSLDNVENYMDYATCAKMFTEGQKLRMHAALEASAGGRNNLWKEANLLLTGTSETIAPQNCAPIANFRVSGTKVCPGTSISVTDLSYNSSSYTRIWSFPGADITSGSDPETELTYNTPGTYSITLIASNASGSDTLEMENVIDVINTTPQYYDVMSEEFSGNTLPSGWNAVNPAGVGFESFTGASYDEGSNAIWIQNRVQGPGGVDELHLPIFNLNNSTSPKLSFYYAYAKKTSSSNDVLNVYISINCGTTWLRRAQFDADKLATVDIQPSGPFTPEGPNDWAVGSVNLSSYVNKPFVQIKLEFVSGLGNNFYLDKFYLGDQNIGIAEMDMGVNVALMPNPASETFNVSIELEENTEIKIALHDIMGKSIRDINTLSLSQGSHTTTINVSDLPNGVYFINIVSNKGTLQRKIVVQH